MRTSSKVWSKDVNLSHKLFTKELTLSLLRLTEMKRKTEGFADPFKTFVMKMKPDAPVGIFLIPFSRLYFHFR